MPIEPPEMFAALRDHHVYDFSHRQLQVGALMAVGYTEKAIAATLGIAEGTVAHHAVELQHKIFDGLEMTPTRTGGVTFIHFHKDCCTRACWEMIEKNQFS